LHRQDVTASYAVSCADFYIHLSLPLSYILFLFFFYSYGDHRDLHSFPTRRSSDLGSRGGSAWAPRRGRASPPPSPSPGTAASRADRKSTRLNSSHVKISYAVFCLKKKKKTKEKIKLDTQQYMDIGLTCDMRTYVEL